MSHRYDKMNTTPERFKKKNINTVWPLVDEEGNMNDYRENISFKREGWSYRSKRRSYVREGEFLLRVSSKK